MTDPIDDQSHLLLDDEWDVEPGDDGDIRHPEAIWLGCGPPLARGQCVHLEVGSTPVSPVMPGRASAARGRLGPATISGRFKRQTAVLAQWHVDSSMSP